MRIAIVIHSSVFLLILGPDIAAGGHSFCGVRQTVRRESSEERALTNDDSRYPSHFGEVKIPIAFFYDKPLLRKLGSVEHVNKYILTVMKTTQVVYDSPLIQQFARVTFYVVKIQEATFPELDHRDGDAYQFLTGLTSWEGNRGIRQVAILLTGVNVGSKASTASDARDALSLTGLANVAILCLQPKQAAGIVEARNFNSAFVLAHEIGHVLSMQHDGDDELETSECNGEHHIMSPSAGEGKVEFSPCSAIAFRNHLRRIYDDNRNLVENRGSLFSRCLNQTSLNEYVVHMDGFQDLRTGPEAGVMFDADKQCQLSHGKGFRADFAAVSSICPMIFCTHNFWQVKSHPALPGTSCATNKKCDARGKCI